MMDYKQTAAGMLFAAGIFLSGCGGGSGGSDGTGSVNTAPVAAPAPVAVEKPVEAPKPPELAADRTELNFVNVNGALPAYDEVTFSLTGGTGSGDLYTFVEPDANLNDGTYKVDMVSDTAMKVTITPKAPAGRVDGNLLLTVCAEDPCEKVVWSYNFPYHYRNYAIAKEIRVRTIGSVDMLVGEGIEPRATPSDLRVTASAADGATWLKAKLDENGHLALNIAGASMGSGSYSGEVQIGTANEAIGTVRIPVSVTIGLGFMLPAPVEVLIDAVSPPTIAGKIAMGFNGGSSVAWTAVSDKPWLLLQKSGGKGGGDVGYTIDTAKLAGLANMASDTATVTFTAAGASPATYRIAVRKNLPEKSSFTPVQFGVRQGAGVRFKSIR